MLITTTTLRPARVWDADKFLQINKFTKYLQTLRAIAILRHTRVKDADKFQEINKFMEYPQISRPPRKNKVPRNM